MCRFWPIYLLDSMAAVEKCRQFSAWLPLDSAAAICWTIHYSLTRSRSSLPGLKCGTYLPGRLISSPDFGFLPTRGE